MIEGEESGIKVRKYIKLEDTSLERGVHSIENRIISLKNDLEFMNQNLSFSTINKILERISKAIKEGHKVYSTGIGTSEAHSKCLSSYFGKVIEHINPANTSVISGTNDILIMLSQGLSPNAIFCLENIDLKNVILITSVDHERPQANANKNKFLQKVKESKTLVLIYPKEQPDDTLIRITGPFFVFYLVGLLKRLYFSSPEQKESRKQ